MPSCENCGRSGADSLCVRCGRVVCDRCFYGFWELCVDCAKMRVTQASSSGISSAGLRMLGTTLIVFGLLITSIALISEGGEGVIVIFPFVFGSTSGWGAVAISIVFFGMFLAMSLLPLIHVFRRTSTDEGPSPLMREYYPGESDVMEYVMTIDVPVELRRTIYIEGEGGMIRLRSSVDRSFYRSYRMPEGFEMDKYEYEHDGSYLLLKLRLVRSI